MRPAFATTNHRPWPLPQQPWVWRQRWNSLLFAHWPVSAEKLRPLVPAPLKVQEFEGTSWVGLVPFEMEDVMIRDFPAVPGLSRFPEINLRLYVEHEGKPGVWFLSLDASNPFAVAVARTAFHLPYYWSEIRSRQSGDERNYTSTRKNNPKVVFDGTYLPTGKVFSSIPGTLEHWLTERYCLYARSSKGVLYRGDVQHPPWPLQPAEAEIRVNQLTTPHGFELQGDPPLLHFSEAINVVMWPLRRCQKGGQVDE